MDVRMLGIQIVILGIILLVLPVVIGTLFMEVSGKERCVPFAWVSGQILLWAGFQAMSIPLILMEEPFTLLCNGFSVYMFLLFMAALILAIVKGRQNKGIRRKATVTEVDNHWKWSGGLWIIFGALLLLQLVLTVFLAYEEGDDAFYVAISTITDSSNSMYRSLPYTGKATGLDARHGLAPFPIWVAYLARMSGMPAVTVAQIALPVVLIGMAYSIYYLIATRLFTDKKSNIPFFLILVEILVLFGGYSVYSAENFLLVRASQGKAVIANIIIPFLFYLLMVLLDKLQKQEMVGRRHWFLLAFTMIAGCLCSTLGTVLTCMLLAVVGLCAAVCYGKGKLLIPMALCCAAPVGMALLYFVLK